MLIRISTDITSYQSTQRLTTLVCSHLTHTRKNSSASIHWPTDGTQLVIASRAVTSWWPPHSFI